MLPGDPFYQLLVLFDEDDDRLAEVLGDVLRLVFYLLLALVM